MRAGPVAGQAVTGCVSAGKDVEKQNKGFPAKKKKKERLTSPPSPLPSAQQFLSQERAPVLSLRRIICIFLTLWRILAVRVIFALAVRNGVRVPRCCPGWEGAHPVLLAPMGELQPNELLWSRSLRNPTQDRAEIPPQSSGFPP